MKKKGSERAKDVVLIYTDQDYEEQIEMGVSPEDAIKPGKYKGRRGGFLERHPEFKAGLHGKKVRVNILLDRDIVEHFKAGGGKYETKINAVLRKFVDGTLGSSETLAKQIAKEVARELKGS
ncbi:MAG: BrnA antitoxin family protein [Acidobacteriota bacterium]